MYTIDTINYAIVCKSKAAYNFLKFSSKRHFSGSTTFFFFIAKIFFRYDFSFRLKDTDYMWPIDGISDFRLIRGEYNADIKGYSIETGYEGVDLLFLQKLIAEGDTIIDLGANKGFYSLFLSVLAGDKGKIIAVEANQNNFKLLLKRINNIWNRTNIIPLNFILGNDNNRRVFLQKPSLWDDGTGFYFRNSRPADINAPFIRKLDTLLGWVYFENIKMIKIDVEGAEFDVLKGAGEVISKAEYILAEVSGQASVRFGHTVTQLFDLLANHNFLFAYMIQPGKDNEPVLKRIQEGTGNILFSKTNLLETYQD